jgi:hypothetical protein
VEIGDVARHVRPLGAQSKRLLTFPAVASRKHRPLLIASTVLKFDAAGLEVGVTPSFAVRSSLRHRPAADQLALLRGFSWETAHRGGQRIVTVPVSPHAALMDGKGHKIGRLELGRRLAGVSFAPVLIGWRTTPSDLASAIARPLETVQVFALAG